MKEFKNIEEMKEYYDEAKNLFYIEDDIKINFDLVCDWNIKAMNIKAKNIKSGDINAGDINAGDINAGDINAGNIDACDISFYAVCFAYNNIKCTSIEGRRENSKYFALDGKVVIEEEL